MQPQSLRPQTFRAPESVEDWQECLDGGEHYPLPPVVRKLAIDNTWQDWTPESAQDFLLRVRAEPNPGWLMEGLVPDLGIMLWHGQPRAGKSLAVLDVCLAIAAGQPGFHMSELDCPEPKKVLYITEEDPAKQVQKRLDALMARRNITTPPKGLMVSVQQGVNIDDSTLDGAKNSWPKKLLQVVRKLNPDLVVLDPARAVSAGFDAGPQQLVQGPAPFIREFNKLGKTLVIVHHDTKPTGSRDPRDRAHQVSGGGILSICDSPVHFERVDHQTFKLVPNMWKFQVAPKPVQYTIRGNGENTGLYLDGKLTDARPAKYVNEEKKLLDYLARHPDSTTNALASALGMGKEKLNNTIRSLVDTGKVVVTPGKNNSRLHSLPPRA